MIRHPSFHLRQCVLFPPTKKAFFSMPVHGDEFFPSQKINHPMQIVYPEYADPPTIDKERCISL